MHAVRRLAQLTPSSPPFTKTPPTDSNFHPPTHHRHRHPHTTTAAAATASSTLIPPPPPLPPTLRRTIATTLTTFPRWRSFPRRSVPARTWPLPVAVAGGITAARMNGNGVSVPGAVCFYSAGTAGSALACFHPATATWMVRQRQTCFPGHSSRISQLCFSARRNLVRTV